MQKKDLLRGMLLFYFSTIPDPRVQGRCKHPLMDILITALAATASGCTSWLEVEEFAIQREEWLRSFLSLPNGIPSHDTFERVFSIVNPDALEAVLRDWSLALCSEDPKVISVDGKSVAGTYRRFANNGTRALHLLNIYCHDQGITLSQSEALGTGFGEVEAALEGLKLLTLKGALVTADAAHAVTRMTDYLREQKADYLIPIKGNQRGTYAKIEEELLKREDKQSVTEVSHAHGRSETRTCTLLTVDSTFETPWKDIACIAHITRTRSFKDPRFMVERKTDKKNYYVVNSNKTKEEVQNIYYVSSRTLTPKELLTATRNHWSIENRLHWTLDVAFLEDQCRVRARTSARNLSALRKIAFNMFKKCPQKGSMKVKMKRAAFNSEYLGNLLFGHSPAG